MIQAAGAYGYSWTRVLSDRARRRLEDRQRAVLSGARACCATSQWAADGIVEGYGIPRDRVFVVGIGAEPIDSGEVQRAWSAPRFLFVGKDWERKNGAAVLAAFAVVQREHPAATLDLVGGHPPVEQAGVTGHGLLDPADVGSQERLRDLYRRATCFVLPSLHEPSAIAYVEAASAGIGSIATASGGSATLVGAGRHRGRSARPRGARRGDAPVLRRGARATARGARPCAGGGADLGARGGAAARGALGSGRPGARLNAGYSQAIPSPSRSRPWLAA